MSINSDMAKSGEYTTGINIFSELNNTTGKRIEDKDSEFNRHKNEVIKNSIESNLMVAINNYNKVSDATIQFAMPKLTDYDWEKLTNGVAMITFLQGLNIGGKIYNGYSIVNNDVNDDYVSEDSIYIVSNGQYYRVTDKSLLENDLRNAVGIVNTDFEVKTMILTSRDESGNIIDKRNEYYYPRKELGAYTSIVNPGSAANINKSISEYLSEPDKKELAKIYYTALGRERYGMYRVGQELK